MAITSFQDLINQINSTLTAFATEVGEDFSSIDVGTDHKLDYTNPHQVTKAQVGLSSADNTSDADKPISTAADAKNSTQDTAITSNTTNLSGKANLTGGNQFTGKQDFDYTTHWWAAGGSVAKREVSAANESCKDSFIAYYDIRDYSGSNNFFHIAVNDGYGYSQGAHVPYNTIARIDAGDMTMITTKEWVKSKTAELVSAPSTASSTGTAGQIAYDSSYMYVCTATNTWKRTALTTW